MKSSTLRQIVEARENRQAVALVTNLDDHSQTLLMGDALRGDDDLESAVIEALRFDRSRVVEVAGGRHFIQVYNTPLRLMIIGAVHIAKPLIQMSQSCGYDVTLIDPRRAFASTERFPEVSLVSEWPDTALKRLGIDSRTAVVTLTHDPKLDEPALEVALDSEAFYIGSLGSRRTHQDRCQRLEQAGISDEQIKRIHAPIGLDISAKSPAEIAVSILSEITLVLRKGSVS